MPRDRSASPSHRPGPSWSSHRDRDRRDVPRNDRDRRRSPPPHLSRERDRGRERGGGPDGGRDSGYAPRSSGGGRGGSSNYTSEERERERANDRRRYDERNRSPGSLAREGGPVMDEPEPPKEAPKPNFANSGALAAETNTNANGVVLKYNEPPEARKPTHNWRLYVFKGKEQVDLFHLSKQSAFLAGRDSANVDIPIAHPSCSKQHAVIQFRQIRTRNEFGDESTSIKPFIIDLESTNATYVNEEEIPTSRYYELHVSDVIKFGQSTREYVLLRDDL